MRVLEKEWKYFITLSIYCVEKIRNVLSIYCVEKIRNVLCRFETEFLVLSHIYTFIQNIAQVLRVSVKIFRYFIPM